jgi:histone H3/H4
MIQAADIIARRKIYQEKKIIKPKSKPVVVENELFDFEDEVISTSKPSTQQLQQQPQPSTQQLQQQPQQPTQQLQQPSHQPQPTPIVDDKLDEVEIEVKKVRGRPAGTKSIAPKVEKEELVLPKQSLIRLIKSTGLQHLSADVIEASIEILQSIVETTIIPGGSVTTDVINKHIEKHFATEKDLPEETFLSAPIFQKFVLSFYTPKSATIKRDAFFLLHLYSEAYLLKMIQAADIIASSSKRARIQGADLTVAYHIYNL